MKERPEFCKNCPLVPRGITAEIAEIKFPTDTHSRRMMATRLAEKFPNAFDAMLRTANVYVEVTDVEGNDSVEVGDEAIIDVWDPDQDEERILLSVRRCEGPKKSRAQKLLGQAGTCQAFRVI